MVLKERLKVVVAVFVVRAPMGPQSWHYLQYAMGLRDMGHDVTVVEVSDDHEWTCYDPTTESSTTDATFGLGYAQRVLDRVGLGDSWAYFDHHHPDGWRGPAAPRMGQVARDADVFLNVSGLSLVEPWFADVPKRVFIDTDPGFVQVRNLNKPVVRQLCEQHNVHLTYGERFGEADCLVPDDGFAWRPTRQPVVLDAWPVTPAPSGAPFTTVMKWDSYRPVQRDSLTLGMKSQSFTPYLNLPSRSAVPLEVIVGGPHPRDLLEELGWVVHNPHELTKEPWDFQDFVQRSAGEFTVAKHGYVVTRCGWFSERSAHYLASGRPVVTQETGFSSLLSTGDGLLSFTDRDGAVAALQEVTARPRHHAAAAREVAAASFEARQVLERLLADVSS